MAFSLAYKYLQEASREQQQQYADCDPDHATAEGDVGLGEHAAVGSNCYAAVIENRAKEVGVALLDVATLTLHLSQFIEPGRSYTTTVLCLDTYLPKELIVVSSTHQDASAAGVNKATRAFAQMRLARNLFDDTKGIMLVDGYAVTTGSGANSSVNSALQRSHYLAFGAAGALLHYITHDKGLALSQRSLKVRHKGAGTLQ